MIYRARRNKLFEDADRNICGTSVISKIFKDNYLVDNSLKYCNSIKKEN